MTTIDTKEYKEILLHEKSEIEKTLSATSNKSSSIPGEWEAKYPDLNVDPSDKNDMADEVEEFDNAIGVNTLLEERLREIDAALERIEQGTYGIDEETGEPIDPERLHANPSARTNIKK